MSDAYTAADFIKRQAVVYRQFEQLAQTLDRIGDVEQAAKVAKDARTAAELDRDVAQADLNKINAQIAESKDAAAEILLMAGADAKTKADQIIAEAIASSEAKLATATANAQAIVDAAQTQADRIKSEYLSVQALSDGLQQSVDTQRDAIAVAQKEFDRINKAIETLKAKIA